MQSYNPQEHPHPGKVLLTELEEIGLSQTTFAKYIDVSSDLVGRVCSGNAPITAALACKISRALGGSPRKWLELQMNHDLVRVEKSEYEFIRTLGSDTEPEDAEDEGGAQ